MKTYTVPLGRAAVSFRTRGPVAGLSAPCSLLADFVWMKPNKEYEIAVDGNPIIVAGVGRQSVVLAHSKNPAVVLDVKNALERNMSIRRIIMMCMQFGSELCESAFLDCALRSGLRHVWATNSLTEHRNLLRQDTKNHLVIKLNA